MNPPINPSEIGKWKDSSSWSRGEDRTNPKAFTLDTGELRIIVHHWIGLGDAWFVSCNRIGIEREDLDTTNPITAMAKAEIIVQRRLSKMLESMK